MRPADTATWKTRPISLVRGDGGDDADADDDDVDDDCCLKNQVNRFFDL